MAESEIYESRRKGVAIVAVLIEDHNLVVKVSTLERKYPGGLLAYRRHTLRFGFCCDGLITRVGSHAGSDIDALVAMLRDREFEIVDEFGYREVAVVDEGRGITTNCSWLRTGKRPSGPAYAYLSDTDPNRLIALPVGWSLEHGSAEAAREPNEVPRQLLFLRRDGSANVFLNKRTGELVRVPCPRWTGQATG